MFVRQYFAWIGWTSRAVPEWFRGQSGATGRSCWRHLDGPEVLVGLRSQRSTPFRDSRSIVLGQTATGSPRQDRRWGKQTPIAELMNGGTAFRTAVRVFLGNKHAIIVDSLLSSFSLDVGADITVVPSAAIGAVLPLDSGVSNGQTDIMNSLSLSTVEPTSTSMWNKLGAVKVLVSAGGHFDVSARDTWCAGDGSRSRCSMQHWPCVTAAVINRWMWFGLKPANRIAWPTASIA